MRAKLTTAIVALAAMTLASNTGDKTLLTEIHGHLELARRSAAAGQTDIALAHADVVVPDRTLRIRIDCRSVARGSQGLYRNALNAAIGLWDDVLGERQFEVVES